MKRKKNCCLSLEQKIVQVKDKLPLFVNDEFSDIQYKYNIEDFATIISDVSDQIGKRLTIF